MTTRRMLPFDAEHLTETEREAERMNEQRDCWNSSRLVRHARSGFRGCEVGLATTPVIEGERWCSDWEAK